MPVGSVYEHVTSRPASQGSEPYSFRHGRSVVNLHRLYAAKLFSCRELVRGCEGTPLSGPGVMRVLVGAG